MKYILLVMSVLLFTCCVKKPHQEDTKSPLELSRKSSFTLPKIPSIFINEEQRIEFLSENYWNNFKFQDTALINQPKFLNHLFTNFLGLLSQVPDSVSIKCINHMMSQAEADSLMYNCFISMSEKYLYDPNSPLRNESLYIAVLKNILASNKIDDAHKIRPQNHYKIAIKNRPGKMATDFRYTLATGKQGRLYCIHSSYTLMYFNNPDCEDCKIVKKQMASSQVLNDLLRSKKLKILSLYPDKDLSIWSKNYSQLPDSWIRAYDKGTIVQKKELYDLKAIPTLYLLDKDKKVLLKDAPFEVIENYLSTIKRL